ncbi:ribosome-associated translation inhibitor RaiA [[Brevibacterium] frigoritolerans]|nr:ribosome-associated translation inhibitor RaiA [Peribacillus frigoritolerans]
MKVQLRGHNFELTEANRHYATHKVIDLERFLQDEKIIANVTVKKFQRSVKAEIKISGTKNSHIRAEVVTEDFYRAIDSVVEKLENQIRKHKTKNQIR